MTRNSEYDEIIVRNSKGRVIRTWTGGPFSSLRLEGRVITRESFLEGTKTFIVSDCDNIEARRDAFWLPLLTLIIALIALCACWGYVTSL